VKLPLPKIFSRRLSISDLETVMVFVRITAREFAADNLMLRALALTYITLLSLVPLMALLFSLFKILGGGEWFLEVVRPTLSNFLAPGIEPVVSERITHLISRFAAKTIGGLGLVLLIVGVHGIFTAVEMVFNSIWGGSPRGRFLVRAPIYWGLFLITPILLGVSLGISTYILALPHPTPVPENIDLIISFVNRAIPAAMAVVGLLLIYRYMPTAPVRWSSAVAGAIIAGLLFEVCKVLFIVYATKLVRYDVLYGSLAIIPLLLVWINLAWVVTLFGVEISYVFQHFEMLRRDQKHLQLSRRQEDALAYRLLIEALSVSNGEGPRWVNIAEAADRWEVPPGVTMQVARRLASAGLIEIKRAGDRLRLASGALDMPIGEIERAMSAETHEEWRWPTEEKWAAVQEWLRKPSGRRSTEATTLKDLLKRISPAVQPAQKESATPTS
jgi:membrane protein